MHIVCCIDWGRLPRCSSGTRPKLLASSYLHLNGECYQVITAGFSRSCHHWDHVMSGQFIGAVYLALCCVEAFRSCRWGEPHHHAHVKGTPVRLHEVQLQTHHWCGSTWKIYLLDLVCVFMWTSCCLVWCSWAPKKLHWDVGIHQFFFLEKMHHGLHIICALDCLIPEQIVQYSLSSVSSLTSFICSLVISSLLHSFASRILGRLPPLLTLQHFLWLFWSCFIPALLELSSQHDNTCIPHEKSWIPVVDVWNRQRQPSYLCLRASLSIAGFLVAPLAPFICSLPDPSFDIAAPLPEKCVEARVSLKFMPKSSH